MGMRMARRWAWLIGVLAWAAAAAGQETAPAPDVLAVSHGTHGARVRLVMTLSAEPDFTVFTLADPPRLVIDLAGATWSAPTPEPIPYVAALRHGVFRPGRLRAVLDLAEPVLVERAFTQAPAGGEPARLILDLAPEDAAAFAARAGWPEAARWSAAETAPAAAPPGAVVVAVDPGHGGIDPGAVEGGLVEKDIVLAFGQRLVSELTARPGFSAFLTRPDDRFVPLAGRIALARAGGAHVLVSLHADTLARGVATGVSVYTLAQTGGDGAAAELAQRENRADILAGADLEGETDAVASLLIDLARRGTGDESEKLAAAVLRALDGRVALLATDPHRRADFRVLRAPDLPALLVELGFLDSPADRARLTSPEWIAATAAALADGLAAWAATASPGFVGRAN